MCNAYVSCVHVCHGEGRPGCQPAEIIYSIPLPFEFAVVVRYSNSDKPGRCPYETTQLSGTEGHLVFRVYSASGAESPYHTA